MASSRGIFRTLGFICIAILCSTLAARVQSSPDPPPIDPQLLIGIGDAVEASIAAGEVPGAVVLVWHRGHTVYRKAFGLRAARPQEEPMTVDTIFDLASLTKVVGTTPAVMMLVEEGRVGLRDPVARYLPGFERHDKGGITVAQLLTHMSGLRADFDLERAFDGYEIGVSQALGERPVSTPGTEFLYSDINFVVLGEIVRRVSGLPLDHFVAERVLGPLGMRDTMFTPPSRLVPRVAPTEACGRLVWPCGGDGMPMLRGTVHDPTARRMGGVAGHAGLFGTADDLARYAAMVLSGGTLDGVRVLSSDTVTQMTTRATPIGVADVRGLGWDIDSRYSASRGSLFPIGSFGHTGFTGPSIWLDGSTRTAVIFLASRLHPDGEGNVVALRARVADVVAAAIPDATSERPDQPVETGVDVLQGQELQLLEGAKVALLTNQTGRARDGTRTVDLLHAAPRVDLRILLSPEHGLGGVLDAAVADSRDPATGLPVYSLYGGRRRPTVEILRGIDTVVVDVQDAGARFYTYATTMAYVMEVAAAHDLRVVVLDRPNPITGLLVEGPMLDASEIGFTGYLSMPVRHGMTLGELARLFNGERQIGARLEVVPMRGWARDLWFDQTRLAWINPSPNLRSVTQAALYPGIGAIEGTNLSVGRGTDTPFELVGAPWIDGPALAARLNARRLAGVRFVPAAFTPNGSTYAGLECQGVRLVVTNRALLRPVRVGLEIASALVQLHGDRYDLDAALRLFGSRDTLVRIGAGDDPWGIARSWSGGEREWRALREAYLLY